MFDNFSQNISFVRNSLLENLCFPEDRETIKHANVKHDYCVDGKPLCVPFINTLCCYFEGPNSFGVLSKGF